jgi:hypothetical protein
MESTQVRSFPNILLIFFLYFCLFFFYFCFHGIRAIGWEKAIPIVVFFCFMLALLPRLSSTVKNREEFENTVTVVACQFEGSQRV